MTSTAYPRFVAEVLAEAARHGIAVVEVTLIRKHWRLWVDTPVGRRFCVVASTSSDHRALLNSLATLRRLTGVAHESHASPGSRHRGKRHRREPAVHEPARDSRRSLAEQLGERP